MVFFYCSSQHLKLRQYCFHTFPYSFFGVFAKLRKVIISLVMSVRPSARNNSALTGRIFMKFGIWTFFANVFLKFNFHCNRTRIKDNLHGNQCIFSIISRSVLLVMTNVSGKKTCRENQNSHFVFSNFFFFKSYLLWDIWKNINEGAGYKW